jgi:uncharacterized protein
MTITTTEKTDIIAKTEAFVRAKLEGEGTGHDWWHLHRVRTLALRLAREEGGCDLAVVELAALLHDIDDWKFSGDEKAAGRAAREWLASVGADAATADHVGEIADTISFKGAGVATPMRTKEGAIVQDADRLEALGAIGIARAFAYGGSKGRELHSPDAKPQAHGSFEAYRKSVGTTINHFYEKLLLLKDRMNTDAGRRSAEARHRYMESYLERFFAEWEGRD